MRRVIALVTLSLATLTACGGGSDEPTPDVTTSAVAADPDAAAFETADDAFESDFVGAAQQLQASATANDGPGMKADLEAMRKALFDFDAAVRDAGLDSQAELRNTLLSAIGEEIALLDTITTAETTQVVLDNVPKLEGLTQDVQDARVALLDALQA